MKRFKVGNVYTSQCYGDHNLRILWYVVKRTDKFLYIKDFNREHNKMKKVKVEIQRGVERAFPNSKSFSGIRADNYPFTEPVKYVVYKNKKYEFTISYSGLFILWDKDDRGNKHCIYSRQLGRDYLFVTFSYKEFLEGIKNALDKTEHVDMSDSMTEELWRLDFMNSSGEHERYILEGAILSKFKLKDDEVCLDLTNIKCSSEMLDAIRPNGERHISLHHYTQLTSDLNESASLMFDHCCEDISIKEVNVVQASNPVISTRYDYNDVNIIFQTTPYTEITFESIN